MSARMRCHRRAGPYALLAALVMAAVGACGGAGAPPVEALAVTDARIVLPPPGAGSAAGYMRMRNDGDAALTLDGLASDAHGRVEVHEMKHEGGMMRMREIPALGIAPGETVSLEPHGTHLMLMAPQRDLAAGEAVTLTIDYRIDGERYQRVLEIPAEAR